MCRLASQTAVVRRIVRTGQSIRITEQILKYRFGTDRVETLVFELLPPIVQIGKFKLRIVTVVIKRIEHWRGKPLARIGSVQPIIFLCKLFRFEQIVHGTVGIPP